MIGRPFVALALSCSIAAIACLDDDEYVYPDGGVDAAADVRAADARATDTNAAAEAPPDDGQRPDAAAGTPDTAADAQPSDLHPTLQ